MINKFIVFVFPLSWMAQNGKRECQNKRKKLKEKSCVVYDANVQYMINMENWKLTSLFLDCCLSWFHIMILNCGCDCIKGNPGVIQFTP